MRLSYLSALLAVFPLFSHAQTFTFGAIGGVPAQTPLALTSTQPYALGGIVDVRILSRLSVESGLLFYGLGHASNLGVFTLPENSITLSSTSTHGHALEIPILAKGYLRAERKTFRPFLTAGLAIHRTSLESNGGASILGGTNLLPLPSEPV